MRKPANYLSNQIIVGLSRPYLNKALLIWGDYRFREMRILEKNSTGPDRPTRKSAWNF